MLLFHDEFRKIQWLGMASRGSNVKRLVPFFVDSAQYNLYKLYSSNQLFKAPHSINWKTGYVKVH